MDSASLVYERYVAQLDRRELDALWADYRVVGRLFGRADHEMPADTAAFREYMARCCSPGDLHVTAEARELRPGSCSARRCRPRRSRARARQPVDDRLAAATLRRQYRFFWDPMRAAALRGGAESMKRLVVPFAPERLRIIPQARA